MFLGKGLERPTSLRAVTRMRPTPLALGTLFDLEFFSESRMGRPVLLFHANLGLCTISRVYFVDYKRHFDGWLDCPRINQTRTRKKA